MIFSIQNGLTLRFRKPDPPHELVVSWEFKYPDDPALAAAPRVISPATLEDTELYPTEIKVNHTAIKAWIKECERLGKVPRGDIPETYLNTRYRTLQDGSIQCRIRIGMMDPGTGDLLPVPPPVDLTRTWSPVDNIITTEDRGEFDISYYAFMYLSDAQEDFINLIYRKSVQDGE